MSPSKQPARGEHAKPKRTARKSSAAKQRSAPKSTAAKQRTALTPAFPQTAGASGKQRLLFDLLRARATLMAAVQGLMGGAVEQPLGEGRWTVRETMLHLCAWDEMALRAFEPARRSIAPEWASARGAALDRLNARGVDALRQHGWDDTLRLLQAGRQRLIESVEEVSDQPANVWARDHALGAMLFDLTRNDRHHAEAIKRWRS